MAKKKPRKKPTKVVQQNWSYLAQNPDWMEFVTGLSDSTSTALVDQWISNTKKNKAKYGFEGRWADCLAGSGDNKVTIMVGGSPALEENVEYLRGLDRRFIVIAVSSSLHFLQQHNVRPTYTMHADALARTAKYLDDVDSSGLTLIANCFSAPEYLERWQGEILFLPIAVGSTHKNASKRYGKITGRGSKPPECFPALGNQYNFGVLFARVVLGSRAIIFCGAEYAYGGKYYAGDRSDGKDNWPKQVGPLPDIFFNPTWTNPPLMQAKLALEDLCSRMPRDVFINATEAGVLGVSARHGLLPFIKQMRLQQAIYTCGKAVDMADSMKSTKEQEGNERLFRSLPAVQHGRL
jgi:hypothetical protein